MGRRTRDHGARAHWSPNRSVRVSASAPLIACAGLIKRFANAGARAHRPRAAGRRPPRAAGPDGAGKTTLLSLLAGSAEASEGSVQRPDNARSAWCPQRNALYRRLSAREKSGALRGGSRACRARVELAELAAAVALANELDCRRAALARSGPRVNVAIGCSAARASSCSTSRRPPRPGPPLALCHARARERAGGTVAFATQNVEEARLAADRCWCSSTGAPPTRAAGGVLRQAEAGDAAAATSARSSPS